MGVSLQRIYFFSNPTVELLDFYFYIGRWNGLFLVDEVLCLGLWHFGPIIFYLAINVLNEVSISSVDLKILYLYLNFWGIYTNSKISVINYKYKKIWNYLQI